MRLRWAISLAAALICWVVLLSLLVACEPAKPLLIGFVANLKGPTGDLGVHARDAVILAVEQQNALGGINGHRLELIVKSVARTRDATLAANLDMLDAGVVAVLGHATSDSATTAVELFNNRRVVMISPTAATTDLTGIDDYFFRVRSDSGKTGARLGEFAYRQAGVPVLSAALDETNTQYTGRWFSAFCNAYERAGGQVADVVGIGINLQMSYSKVAERLLASHPKGVVIVSSSLDAALICQQLRKSGFNGAVFLSGWSMTPDLVVHGGSSIEGVFAAQPFDPNHENKSWKAFKTSFTDRFGYEPSFAAMHSYDAAQLLFQALAKSLGQGVSLKEAILEMAQIDGLQGVVKIDQYGDADHEIWVQTVINGQLVKVE